MGSRVLLVCVVNWPMAQHLNLTTDTCIRLTHASSLISGLLSSKDPGTESALACVAGNASLSRDDAATVADGDTNPSVLCGG